MDVFIAREKSEKKKRMFSGVVNCQFQRLF